MTNAGHIAHQPDSRGTDASARAFLRELLDAAIGAADPFKVLPPHLPERPMGRCIIVGAGKAAAAMAAAVEHAWPEVSLSGCVAVPYGYAARCRSVRVIEAGHPVPDANSVQAAQAVLAAVEGLTPDDLVLALISGGGSATLSLPADGLTLEGKQAVNRLLLHSGLDIRTMNAVRRHLSAIKGGRLAAAAAPARVITLAISDIPGDDPAAIASGPTVQPPPPIDLAPVIARLGNAMPAAAHDLLAAPAAPIETGNADPVRLIATPAQALEAAAALAKAKGIEPLVLGDAIEGEARAVGASMARRALEAAGPVVLLSGGETTVTIGSGTAGRGGRNTEFVLALALALEGKAGIWALAADTDGEDGANLGAAGALCAPDTLARARRAGLDPVAALEGHDSGTFFEALGDLVVTGPTLTNVNDFRGILIVPTGTGDHLTGRST